MHVTPGGRLGRAAVAGGIAASSAAVLVLEIVLTRVFAIAQFHHFAFVAVSLALLGFGASGSALTAFPALGRGGPRRWAQLAVAQAVTTVGGYAVANALPFDSYSIAWDRRQVLYLVVYYLALAVPFFFGGAVVAVLLAGAGEERPLPSHAVYGASLAGAGAGCLLALAALGPLGGVGVIALAALLAVLAALAFELAAGRRATSFAALLVGLAALAAFLAARPPEALALRLSPYKGLSAALRYPGAEILSTRWSAAARVDHVRSGGIRSLPGLSFAYLGDPPPQDGLAFDGDDLSPVPLVAPEEAPFVPYLLSSLPFALRPGAEALVLEPRGGLDVLVALASGVSSVVAVEPSEAAVAAALGASPAVYGDPRVRVLVEEPRVHVERSRAAYDVVDLALTAPYRPVSSGAYSLNEDYRLTREAFAAYLTRLRPGGLLAVLRWLQTPPSEETRLLALAAQAVREAGGDPGRSVVALRGYSTALVLVRNGAFTPAELRAIRAFAEARRFDLLAGPGLTPEEANRYNVLPEDSYFPLARALLGPGEPAGLYESYGFEIAPPTDDRPFFGHYFKWSQAPRVLETLGKTWQPFGGAGYFVLLALLALVALAALLSVVAPLGVLALRHRGRGRPPRAAPRAWTLAYFGLLGIAFLFVEIPLIQRSILLVGRPTAALAVVLFSLLVASGAGSLLSRRVPWRPAGVALAAAVAAYPFLLRPLTEAVLPFPLAARLVVGGLVLVPLGLLMGTMFPRGIARLEERAPELVPWAWAINGFASVTSAVGAALLALTLGFTWVILLAACLYAACALLAPRRPARRPGAATGRG